MPHRFAGAVRSPEFPPGLDWFNSPPLTMAMLRGKLVVLRLGMLAFMRSAIGVGELIQGTQQCNGIDALWDSDSANKKHFSAAKAILRAPVDMVLVS